jgi:hypothetical protein
LGRVEGLGLILPPLAPQDHRRAAGAEVLGTLRVAHPIGGAEKRVGPPHEPLRAGLTSSEALQEITLFLVEHHLQWMGTGHGDSPNIMMDA